MFMLQACRVATAHVGPKRGRMRPALYKLRNYLHKSTLFGLKVVRVIRGFRPKRSRGIQPKRELADYLGWLWVQCR